MDFPLNVVDVIQTTLKEKLPRSEYVILRRPLRTADPNNSIGLFPNDWMPREGSREMGFIGDTLGVYSVRIHLLVKVGNEEEGRAQYAVRAKKLRTILAHDADLHVRLGGLAEVDDSTQERLRRYGVRNQRFLNNELSGQFLFLATTEFWVETETSRV